MTWVHYRNQLLQMLYDDGLTLQELADIFGLTRQRVRQLVVTRGPAASVRWGPRDDPRTPPSWLVDLVEIGALTATAAADYCGCSSTAISSRVPRNLKQYPTHGYSHLSSPAARAALADATCLLMAAAWMDGATIAQLATIFGSSEGAIGIKMHRMRQAGYCLPYRRGGSVAATND